MKRTRLECRLLLGLTLAWVQLLPLSGQESEADRQRISSELSRLREAAQSLELNESNQKLVERLSQRMQEIEAALDAGRPHRALRLLEPVFIQTASQIVLAGREELAKEGPQAMEKELGRLNVQFEEQQRQLDEHQPSAQAALALALTQLVRRTALPYQQSARQFSRASNFFGGIYYLGIARDSLGFSEFCLGFEARSPLPHIDIEELRAAHQQLEAGTLQAYERPGAAIELHSQFIALNSSLKEGRELLAENSLFGALDKVLEARLKLSMIEGSAAAAPQRGQLTENSARSSKRLSGKLDHGIGLSYWEEAQELLDNPQPSAEDLKRAGVILDQVLPLYFRIIQEPAP